MLDENVSDDGIPTLQQDHRIELRHLLVRLSKAAGVLPSSMFLQNVQCIDRESVAGGAFADIFVAVYQGQQVALKRHRTFLAGRAEADTYNAVSMVRGS